MKEDRLKLFREAFYDLVPKDGSTIGNKALQKRIQKRLGRRFSEKGYWEVREVLIREGILMKGKGRGGAVSRAKNNSTHARMTNNRAKQKNTGPSVNVVRSVDKRTMMDANDTNGIERRLWRAADKLRANSNYASNEYFLPVMGLIFLRHSFSRFERVKAQVEPALPRRGGKPRKLRKEDFSGRGAIFLSPESRFDYLIELPEDRNLPQAIVHAMESIEEDYKSLKGVLPKQEYEQLDNEVLRQLLRTFNDPALKEFNGDVFGRIYEYFLTKFAGLKAHDDGEFFTPFSLVQMIVNVIEPERGTVLDPACGSGGMFVQSAHFIENEKNNPRERVTFYGIEKNETTIRLAQMNLAVHGLEGNIQKGITYYDDPHALAGKADFVMANPPFNVDEVDADKVENDPRLPFGLPGVNKEGKVTNGNYLWISYFYSYLNNRGRAGFIMSSQASSAAREEARVRQALAETGALDLMIAIRGNFFYTRSVPCELWFLNRHKPEHHRDKVLMIDARNIYRKVTRKIYDFTPEQLQNLTSIVWLYRGETDRFLKLIADYLVRCLDGAKANREFMDDFQGALACLVEKMTPFLDTLEARGPHAEPLRELEHGRNIFDEDTAVYLREADRLAGEWSEQVWDNASLHETANGIHPLAEQSRNLIKQADQLYKLAGRVIDVCEKEHGAKRHNEWPTRKIGSARKTLNEVRKVVVHQLSEARYFYRQACWLQERFPDAELADVKGLVKLVSLEEIKENDWSVTPGRYVGVAPEEPDEDFDFEETLRDIHIELRDLNYESNELSKKILRNFEALGV